MTGKHSVLHRSMLAVLMLAWPFLIWFGVRHNSLSWMTALIALFLILRLKYTRYNAGPISRVMMITTSIGLTLCASSYLLRSHHLLLWYPVVINLAMLTTFGSSLWSKMSLVEQIARLQDPNLPEVAIRYTRKVTQVWCLFFIANGTISTSTCLYGDMDLWTLWNGVIAYLLMGLLMIGEWLIRQRLMKRNSQ